MWTKLEQMIKSVTDRLADLPAGFSMSMKTVQLLLAVVAVTILSFLAVDIFYKIISLQMVARKESGKDRITAALPQTGLRQPLERYSVITERNIFQTTLNAIADKSAGPLLPTEEYTAFDLKGTIAVDENAGYAIVEERGKGKQKLYRIGDMIGSARLVRVTRNTAVLNSDGRDLVMKIKETAEGASLGRLTGSGNNIAISRQEVMQNMGDLKSIMSQAVVRPYITEGAQQGFIISNIVPGSLYERLGLKNGDVVMDVNDKKLNSADDIFQMVNVMQAGGSISVNVMRNGRNETLNYSFH